jgi:hypothetical protein
MTIITEREADDESLSSSVGDEVIQGTGNKRKNETEVLRSFDEYEEEEQKANTPKQNRHRTRPTEALKPLACPYFKRYPMVFSTTKVCVGPGWRTVYRLK